MVAGPILATLFAIVLLWNRYVGWADITLLFVMYLVTGLGVTIGFHRLLTHRSFKAGPILEFVLLALGASVGQGGPIYWSSIHIQHHAMSDSPGDPHSPTEGFFHAHFGWILSLFYADPNRYGQWLGRNKIAVFIEKTTLFWVALGFLIPYLIAGVSGLFWGGAVRMFVTNHITWSVNSVCHSFGSRPYQTNDLSRNNFLIGLLAWGEGWHNNHHAFPRSAFHGLKWWQFDLSGLIIRMLEQLGLVTDVVRVDAEVERKMKDRLLREQERREQSVAEQTVTEQSISTANLS